TRTATEIIIDFIRFSSSKALLAENYKILWIAQSSELCIQAYETFEFLYNKKGTSPIRIGHYYGKETFTDEIIDSPAIIFCGIQKLLKNYENNIWSKIKKDNYLVIVDEAHRSVATQWKKALDFFVDNNSTFLLGLTATPGSGSIDDISAGYTVAEYYDNNKITLTDEKYQEIDKPIQYLIERDFLANINRIDIQSTVEFRKELEATDDGFVFTGETLDALSI